MRNFFIVWGLFVVSLITNMPSVKAEDTSPVIAVVVANNQATGDLKLAKIDLSLIYWRKQLYWAKGLRIKPVNLRAEHPLRQQFSQRILGTLPKQQIDYWNGLYFNGVSPPHTVNSEEAVIRYVADTIGSIGYVDACLVDDRIKAILWINHDQIMTNAPNNIHCQ